MCFNMRNVETELISKEIYTLLKFETEDLTIADTSLK